MRDTLPIRGAEWHAWIQRPQERDVFSLFVYRRLSDRVEYLTVGHNGLTDLHRQTDEYAKIHPFVELAGPYAEGLLCAIADAIREAKFIPDRERELELVLKATEASRDTIKEFADRAFAIIERKWTETLGMGKP